MMLRESDTVTARRMNRCRCAMLFGAVFVLVGMLFEAVLLTDPVKVLAVTLVIMVGKTLAAVALVLLMPCR